jgi:hypothetical protein
MHSLAVVRQQPQQRVQTSTTADLYLRCVLLLVLNIWQLDNLGAMALDHCPRQLQALAKFNTVISAIRACTPALVHMVASHVYAQAKMS